MPTQPTGHQPTETPVETPFADAASPFKRTKVPFVPGPPEHAARRPAASTWTVYRSQINFGLAMLAYLMVLVGAITVVQANPSATWRYYVAAFPIVPGVFALVIFMRALERLNDVQARIQVQAFGLAVGGTGLFTLAYGFFEGGGLPAVSSVYVLPMMLILWAAATAFFTWRYR